MKTSEQCTPMGDFDATERRRRVHPRYCHHRGHAMCRSETDKVSPLGCTFWTFVRACPRHTCVMPSTVPTARPEVLPTATTAAVSSQGSLTTEHGHKLWQCHHSLCLAVMSSSSHRRTCPMLEYCCCCCCCFSFAFVHCVCFCCCCCYRGSCLRYLNFSLGSYKVVQVPMATHCRPMRPTHAFDEPEIAAQSPASCSMEVRPQLQYTFHS